MFYVKLLKTPAENQYSEQYSNQQIYSILVGLVPVKKTLIQDFLVCIESVYNVLRVEAAFHALCINFTGYGAT